MASSPPASAHAWIATVSQEVPFRSPFHPALRSRWISPGIALLMYLASVLRINRCPGTGIDYLDVPKFTATLRRYFRHFLPTVRPLALREPGGSRRQIIYFLGLFRRPEDFKLHYDVVDYWEEPVDVLTLTPPFGPPFGGRLMMTCFTRVDVLKDMIRLFRGIRFHSMDTFNVYEIRLLFDACAET